MIREVQILPRVLEPLRNVHDRLRLREAIHNHVLDRLRCSAVSMPHTHNARSAMLTGLVRVDALVQGHARVAELEYLVRILDVVANLVINHS